MRAYIIINGIIYEAEVKVDWSTDVAVATKVAHGKQFNGYIFSKFSWCVTLDQARYIARKQVETIVKNLENDPMEQSTWFPYLQEVKEERPIIYRFDNV